MRYHTALYFYVLYFNILNLTQTLVKTPSEAFNKYPPPSVQLAPLGHCQRNLHFAQEKLVQYKSDSRF